MHGLYGLPCGVMDVNKEGETQHGLPQIPIWILAWNLQDSVLLTQDLIR